MKQRNRNKTHVMPLHRALKQPLDQRSRKLLTEPVVRLPDRTVEQLTFGPDTIVALKQDSVVYAMNPDLSNFAFVTAERNQPDQEFVTGEDGWPLDQSVVSQMFRRARWPE